jgi:hypothetical protein
VPVAWDGISKALRKQGGKVYNFLKLTFVRA